MKKLILPILVLAMVGFTTMQPKLTDAEREMAEKELMATQERMLNTLEGLSEAQLNYKSSDESWSIANCAEHLAISENAFSEMLKGSLETPADPSKRDSIKMSDEDLLNIIRDRSNKVKTSEAFEPSGKFGSHMETVEAFNSKRAEHIAYVKTTEDDLRNHYGQLPFGTIDAYQMILFMSGHTERHVKQMEEVMASEGFPKE